MLEAYLAESGQEKYVKDVGVLNAASPRFIVTHKHKLRYWSNGYPNGWSASVKPYLDRLVGPEYARG